MNQSKAAPGDRYVQLVMKSTKLIKLLVSYLHSELASRLCRSFIGKLCNMG